MSAKKYHTLVAASISLGLAAILSLAMLRYLSWAHVVAAWLFSVNMTSFFYYWYDKMRAQEQSRRVPEVVLHGLSVVGGSFGAYAAMRLFRHKTIKGEFRLVFWTVVVVQLLLVGAVLYRLLFVK
jgi:uncharacterized membrane protein YsdA (DUF1294 family)